MNCPQCGISNVEGVANCVRCGAALVPASDAETFAGASMPPLPPGANPTPVPPRVPANVSVSSAPTTGPWAVGVAPGHEPDQVDFGPRYRIERMLGQGGMGAVYKAHDKELDRTVALKLIRPGLALDPAVAQRFKQELLLASRISHKNILRIHDLGDAAGMKFISMAYVEGQDLHQVLTREGKLPLERALHIARQLCAALQAAHSEGVVHRDFKPQNILLDKNDNLYVSDFGLAKSLEHDTGMTRSGEFLGTPRYMAPEQVEGKKIDHRVDLYALGLILYEMVTGDVPFHADSTLQLMYKRVHEAPKSPKTLNPDLPDWVVRVIMKCLERGPDQRYQTAGAILHDLETGTAPVGSRSMQITLPAIAVTASRLWIVAGALVLVLAGLFAIPGVRHRVLRAGTTAQQAAPIKHVAVLPLRVIGDANALGYIGDGIVDAITAKLFQLKDVQMASPSAVAKVKPDTPLPEVSSALGANLIVSGNLQGEGDKIRLVLNLDDVGAGRRLWTQEFSGLKQDLLTLEDNAYSSLMTGLSVKASSEEIARASAHPTENIDAYDFYLKGKNAFTRGELDPKNLQAAIEFYDQALKRDSSFALAYAGIADASLRMYRERKDPIWAQKALGAAEQAQRLGDTVPEVHLSLGSVYSATGRTSEAIVELQRALQLTPNSDEGYRRLGDAYRAAGRKDDALRAYQKAVDLNPYYWVNHNALGGAYVRFGDNEGALAAYNKVISLAPALPVGYRNLGTAYLREGKYNESIPAFQKALQLQPDYIGYSNLGTAYFYLRRYGEAVPMFEKAVAMNPNDEVAAGNLADAYRWSGQKDKANASYDQAIRLALKELQVNPRKASTMGSLALYFAKKGELGQAEQYIRRARAIDANEVSLIYIQGVVQAMVGKSSDALESLRECFQKGYPASEARNDPELGTLSSQPEFNRLLAQFSKPKS